MSKDLKDVILNDLETLSQMSVKEYTLFRGWDQIHNTQWSTQDLQRIWEIKNSIWKPKSPDDYLNLQPQIIQATNPNTTLKTWRLLRTFSHTAHWNQSPGRLIRYYVINKPDKKYLGIISLGSDFMLLGPRDNYIKWTG